ncbi:MAG TPA: DUF3418 domain-containing protein, partial [Candidatus Berkiella sp.]|nr:DUF3418 domain-containing protein [Candidatus Berkiella sp.]
EPHFDLKEQKVVAYERATLFGLEIISRRKINYEKISPIEARKIFILQGLVEEQVKTRCAFYLHNCQTTNHLRALEDRIRRQAVMVDEGMMVAFYEQHLPIEILSTKALESWAKEADQNVLVFKESDISMEKSAASWTEYFPLTLIVDNNTFKLSYQFDLSAENDGVTIDVPIDTLAELQNHDFSWLIEGLLTEKIATYLKALPKRFRILLNPLPETIKEAKASLNRHLLFVQSLCHFLKEKRGLNVEPSIWDNVLLPAYLKMHFKVVGAKNEILATGDDLAQLYDKLRDKFTEQLAQHQPLTKKDIVSWNFGEIPQSHVEQKNRLQLIYYPALTDSGNTVSLNHYDSPELASYYHRLGLARLYLLTLKDAASFIKKQIQSQKKIFQSFGQPLGELSVLTDAILLSAAVHTFSDTSIRTQIAFDVQLAAQRQGMVSKANTLIGAVKEWLALNQQIENMCYRLADKSSKEMQAVLNDIETQLKNLFEQHFMSQVPWVTLMRYSIYLKGILTRLESVPRQLARDKQIMQSIIKVQKVYDSKLASIKKPIILWD